MLDFPSGLEMVVVESRFVDTQLIGLGLVEQIRCTVLKFIDDSSRIQDLLCGLVVRVSGYRFRGPGFYSRRFQIF
jgi:hypothetical protein